MNRTVWLKKALAAKFLPCDLREAIEDMGVEKCQEGAAENICVSHRWESLEHPDPGGNHFQAVKNLPVDDQTGVWYDYSCLHQESQELMNELSELVNVFACSVVMIQVPPYGRKSHVTLLVPAVVLLVHPRLGAV